MLLLYILWDDWPSFMISSSNEQLKLELEYTQIKPDYHSWWISKMQSEREDTLEERYAIKFCFKLGTNATKTYGKLQIPDIGLAVRVFANGPGDLGSIPGRVIPKTQKMVLDASLLNTQHYKVRIKGKVEQSREGVAPSPTPWCSSYRKGSLRVTLDYGRQPFTFIRDSRKAASLWGMMRAVGCVSKSEHHG